MPLTQIVQHLWIGTLPPFLPDACDRAIIASWEYNLSEHPFKVPALYVPLHDDESPLCECEALSALQAGRAAAAWIQRNIRVLITSVGGMNRAGLIAGVAMMSLGLTAAEAIKEVRAARGEQALRNPHFLALLQRNEWFYAPRRIPMAGQTVGSNS